MGSHTYSADQVLSPYMWVFYAAFAAAFSLTPVMQVVASRFGIIDQPDRHRKLHGRAVPYLGGVAIFAGWASGLAVSVFLCTLHGGAGGGHPKLALGIFLAALITVGLGLWDDVQGIRPNLKIAGQLVAAAILLMSGVGTHSTQPALAWFTGAFCRIAGIHDPLAVSTTPIWFTSLVTVSSALLTILVILGSCNATNLMDGLDGLCGGVTAIIAAGFLFVCIHVAMSGMGGGANGDATRMILALAMLGAVLGFVPHNFNPASIFMGDTGSMFLGFCCGTLMLLMAEVQSKWFLAAMVIFALPVLDTALAFARRWIAGRPLFSPDSKHFHHQLMQRGFSVRKTVLIGYALAISFGVLGVAMVFMRTRFAVAFYLVIFASIAIAAFKMGMIHEKPVRRRKSLKAVEPISLPAYRYLLRCTPDHEFRNLLTVTWETACRSRESFAVEASQVDLISRCWVLPPVNNGSHKPRRIHLTPTALEITQQLMRKHPEGPLFRDEHGRPWNLDKVGIRFELLRSTLGRRYSLKALRLGRARAVLAGDLGSLGIQIARDEEYLLHRPAREPLGAGKKASEHTEGQTSAHPAEGDVEITAENKEKLEFTIYRDEVARPRYPVPPHAVR